MDANKIKVMSNSYENNIVDLQPKISQINSSYFDGIFTDGLKDVKRLFEKYNYDIRIAGGAVRDLLMGIKPHDVDLATTARPEQVIELFEKEEVRMINTSNGLSHGTVTCRTFEENFEITTLRFDRVTDGRRAEVEFTTNWAVDASRRDFTVNSMFLDFNGNIIDYFNGVEDLKNRRVVFVGDPVCRIQEDYLRILRYFRFFARISSSQSQHDPQTLHCIKENLPGLQNVAGERLWMEMKLIFNGKLMVETVNVMYKIGLLKYIGFPSECNLEVFENKFKSTKHLNVNHMTFVSGLLKYIKDVETLEKRVKFSKKEREIAAFILLFKDSVPATEPDKLKCYKDIIVDNVSKIPGAKEHVQELLIYKGDFVTLQAIMDWQVPKFPLSGKLLIQAGVPKGKNIGYYMNFAKEEWKKSNFTFDSDELAAKALKHFAEKKNNKEKNEK